MKFLDEEKIRYIILSVIIVLELIIIGVEVLPQDCKNAENNEVIEVTEDIQENEDALDEVVSKKIIVDIKGAVKKAGVYEFDEGARVSDLIKAAGGLKSNASTKYLNLSKKLTDEMVIKIYTENQVKNMNISYNVVEECNCSKEDISSCAGASVIENGNGSSSNNTSSNKVSLNNATKDELMTLSGVGEAKAEAIIEYREKNNGFKSIEEIMNVAGIGESAYNKIKDYITL